MKIFEFPDLPKLSGKQIEQASTPPQPEEPVEQPTTLRESKPSPSHGKHATVTEWKPSVQVQHHFIPGVSRIPNGSPRAGMNATGYSAASGLTNQKYNVSQSLHMTHDPDYTSPSKHHRVLDPDSHIYLSPLSQPSKRPPSEEGKGINSSRNIDRGKLMNQLNSKDSLSKNYGNHFPI